jgi:hypothetical protein
LCATDLHQAVEGGGVLGEGCELDLVTFDDGACVGGELLQVFRIAVLRDLWIDRAEDFEQFGRLLLRAVDRQQADEAPRVG